VLKLLGTLLGQDEGEVRIAAAELLGGWTEQRAHASTLLTAALTPNAKLETVQDQLLRSLGLLGEEASAPAVHRFLDDKSNVVARAAIDAAGQIRSRTSIEPLLELLKKLEKLGQVSRGTARTAGGIPGQARKDSNRDARERVKALRDPCLDALKSITRESFKTYEEWSGWWAKNRAAFKVEK
jgi:HEAT repeat protein